MEIQGSIKKITDVQAFGASGFQKREVIIQTIEQYPQILAVEFTQERVNLPENFKVGDEVVISINIRGREWTNPQGEVKYFTSINGWKIDRVGDNPGQEPTQASPRQATSASATTTDSPFEEEDDLPF